MPTDRESTARRALRPLARRLGLAGRADIDPLWGLATPDPRADVLVAGWFSWPGAGATAGDLMAADVACEWIHQAGRTFDVARAAPFPDGVDFRRGDPVQYRDVVFVCGPVHPETPIGELLDRYPDARHVGLSVSMIRPLGEWNPFDVLIERESDGAANPDLAFGAAADLPPVIGLALVEPYAPEYPGRDRQDEARGAAEGVVRRSGGAVLPLDTRLDQNSYGLRTQGEVEAVVSRMDALVTTRLHGLVLALRRGVPPLAIDPVAGGAKISAQAHLLGWPAVVTADEADPDTLDELLAYCLGDDARRKARECSARARDGLDEVRRRFVSLMQTPRA